MWSDKFPDLVRTTSQNPTISMLRMTTRTVEKAAGTVAAIIEPQLITK